MLKIIYEKIIYPSMGLFFLNPKLFSLWKSLSFCDCSKEGKALKQGLSTKAQHLPCHGEKHSNSNGNSKGGGQAHLQTKSMKCMGGVCCGWLKTKNSFSNAVLSKAILPLKQLKSSSLEKNTYSKFLFSRIFLGEELSFLASFKEKLSRWKLKGFFQQLYLFLLILLN